MILTVIFCLSLNSYMCQELRMVPEDYRAVISMGDCLMGGAIGSTTFIKEHQEYVVKGFRCESEPPRVGEVEDWVKAEQERLARAQPQIK
jgi:hypothetical protein